MSWLSNAIKHGSYPVLSRYRTALIRVATFGDSTAAVGTTGWDTSVMTAAAFPGSGATSLIIASNKYQVDKYYPRLKLVANGGVTGETTAQMLARDAAGAGSTRMAINDILSVNPHVILLRGGSINDLLTVTSGTWASQAATTLANHKEIINRLLVGGAIVIDSGIFGFSGSATDLTSTRLAIASLNASFKAYAATLPGRVYFIDPVGIGLSDATGAYLTGISSDNTHLNYYGAMLHAKAEAALLARLFGPSFGNRFEGTNIATNPDLKATGSPGYGTVATGIAITTANATRQNAKVEVINGQYWQTCEFAVSAPAAQAIMKPTYDPTGTGSMAISVNDIWGFEFDYMVEGVTLGTTPVITSINARVDNTKTGNGRVVLDHLACSSYSIPAMTNGLFKGHVAIGPYQFSEASAALSTASNIQFLVQTDDVVTFKMGMSNVRIVKLAQPVVTN